MDLDKTKQRLEQTVGVRFRWEIRKRWDQQTNNSDESKVESNVEDNVESNIESNIESKVESNVENNVESNIESNIESNTGGNIESESAAGGKSIAMSSYEDNGKFVFKVKDLPEGVLTLVSETGTLTDSERRLIEWILEDIQEAELASAEPKKMSKVQEEERSARSIGSWILTRLEAGDVQSPLPDPAFLRNYQYETSLVLLLETEFKDTVSISYKELKKLIDTYFESETVLIPLTDREWIVLASNTVLLSASEGEDLGESNEELMESIAQALHEMILEWFGECRVSTTGLIYASSHLLTAVQQMRDAIRLGRMFHGEEGVHLPWKLHLERLLYSMDDQEKRKFLDQLLKSAEHSPLDSEMISTLRTFFQNDCNISETSKTLYIHRNTLLYRLDKFKQATGMDVRNFQDAVLVHMALLLYKITK